ncbi:hypothetical protein PCE1_001570 [Barthelona sp. PCE]
MQEEFLDYLDLTASTVIQDCQVFHRKNVDKEVIGELSSRLLFILQQGYELSQKEKESLFFGLTKVVTVKDLEARRNVALALQHVAYKHEHWIMIVNNIITDLTGSTMERVLALRLLGTITDESTLVSVERFVRQAFGDSRIEVVETALSMAIHCFVKFPNVVSGWQVEAEAAMKRAKKKTVAHHLAITLLVLIRGDNVSRLEDLLNTIGSLKKMKMLTGLGILRQIESLFEAGLGQHSSVFQQFIVDTLKSNSKLLIIECIPICLRYLRDNERLFDECIREMCDILKLRSSQQSNTLLKIQFLELAIELSTEPQLGEMLHKTIPFQQLMTDKNELICALATLFMLNTADVQQIEASRRRVPRIFKKSPIPIRQKMLDALVKSTDRNNALASTAINLMATIFREESSKEMKGFLVHSVQGVIKHVPSSRMDALGVICEFIEDCDVPALIVDALSFVAEQIPLLTQPTQSTVKFLLPIFNRCTIDVNNVRVAAVQALGEIGARKPEFVPYVVALLRRVTNDANEEVRDRARLVLSALQSDQTEIIDPHFSVSFDAMEKAARRAIAEDAGFLSWDVVSNLVEEEEEPEDDVTEREIEQASKKAINTEYIAALEQHLGDEISQLVHSSEPILITEEDAEFPCYVVKHFFPTYIALEFKITNTLDDNMLDTVYAIAAEWQAVPCKEIWPGETGRSYAFRKIDESIIDSEFAMPLRFKLQEVDAASRTILSEEDYEDEYSMDPIFFEFLDFVMPSNISSGEFQRRKKALDRFSRTFILSAGNPADSIDLLLSLLNGKILQQTSTVVKVAMCYVWMDKETDVLVTAQAQPTENLGEISLSVNVSTTTADIAENLFASIE